MQLSPAGRRAALGVPRLLAATESAWRSPEVDRNAGGYYSYWDTGRRAPLRELLVNEGLAVHATVRHSSR